jgi:membrane protein YdbS with pleckstrin-like domain
MTVLRSSFFRPFGALFKGASILLLLLAGWAGFVATVMYTHEGNPKPFRKRAIYRHPLFAIPAAATLLFGLPLTACAFLRSRGRYRLGPAELEVSEGVFTRKTSSIPYADIQTIDRSRGPLMRLLGTSDLIVTWTAAWPVTLFGVRGADEIRERILERRDSLRELRKSEEEASSARVAERLVKALERVEKRLQ